MKDGAILPLLEKSSAGDHGISIEPDRFPAVDSADLNERVRIRLGIGESTNEWDMNIGDDCALVFPIEVDMSTIQIRMPARPIRMGVTNKKHSVCFIKEHVDG